MAGTKIPAGKNDSIGPGGFFPDKNNKAVSPKEKLKSSRVTFGKFIDKRAGK